MASVPVCGDCGWRGKPTSPARAKFSRRQHSCDLYRARAERAARVAARKAADGTHRDCHHKIARHEHGTHSAYVLDRCRCRQCRDAVSAYSRQLAKRHLYGRPPCVDAASAREHVRQLMADGMGLKRIAAVSGVSHGALWKLLYGKRRPDGSRIPSRTIRRDTEAALLAVTATMDTLAAGAIIDGTGTTRRLQALVALGWSQSKLARRLGIVPANFTPLVQYRRVTVATAKAVADLYEHLAHVKPPETNQRERIAASRARNYAGARDWKPPLWWDDIDNDPHPWLLVAENVPASGRGGSLDLTDDVDPVVVERLARGESVTGALPSERFAAYCILRRRGISATRAAEQVGASSWTRTVFADAYTNNATEATG